MVIVARQALFVVWVQCLKIAVRRGEVDPFCLPGMTYEEARHVLSICKVHSLPRPHRSPRMDRDGYQLSWKTKSIRFHVNDYDAALHFCRALFVEQRGRSFS